MVGGRSRQTAFALNTMDWIGAGAVWVSRANRESTVITNRSFERPEIIHSTPPPKKRSMEGAQIGEAGSTDFFSYCIPVLGGW